MTPGVDGASYLDGSVTPGETYRYRLGLFENGTEIAGPSTVVTAPAVEFALRGMLPNPTDGAGAVGFALPRPGRARIAIYSVSGRLERVLFDGAREAGEHRIAWDGLDARGRRLDAGVYFLTLETPLGRRTERFVMIR